MKKLITLALLCFVPFVAYAHTQNGVASNPSPASDANDVSIVTVTPTRSDFLAQHRYAMRSDEFHQFKREYELSNGQTVSLFSRGPLMYAKLDNGTPERIVATSHNTFLSTRSDLKLKLNILADGEIRGEAFVPSASYKSTMN